MMNLNNYFDSQLELYTFKKLFLITDSFEILKRPPQSNGCFNWHEMMAYKMLTIIL